MSKEEQQSKRATCERCARPPRACYCASLPSREVRTAVTRVLVLQHEREQRRRQAISSVPVLRLVLEQDVDVVRVAEHCECGKGVDARLDELLYADDAGFDAALVLFPDAQAKPLDAELRGELGLKGGVQDPSAVGSVGGHRMLLVVIDGTWTEAKKIAFHTRHHWAEAAESWRRQGKRFEYVCLGASKAMESEAEASQGSGSIYGDLRREPMDGCVSTLEAVAGALRVLEPSAVADSVSTALLTAFSGMVATQSAFQQRGKSEALRRHGGVSKMAAIQAKQLLNETTSAGIGSDPPRTPTNAASLSRQYVFFSTRTDLRQRQELAQQGDPMTCTYDQARDRCSEVNAGRKRGQRLAFLPLDVFQQRIRAQSELLDADGED